MIVETTETVGSDAIVAPAGEVFGLAMRTRGIESSIVVGFAALGLPDGNPATRDIAALSAACDDAVAQIVTKATALGANAPIAMRFDHVSVGHDVVEIVAYGTALVVHDPSSLTICTPSPNSSQYPPYAETRHTSDRSRAQGDSTCSRSCAVEIEDERDHTGDKTQFAPTRGGITVGTITTQDGTQIYYKDWGAGQPLCLHHGWPLSADDWDAQMMFFLEQGYRVIADDRRGHGRSTQTDSGNEMDTYAADVRELVEKLDLRDAVHIGHSTGGMEVARYVARFGGGRVAKAVLISAVPPVMVQSDTNPDGVPIAVFDGFRE